MSYKSYRLSDNISLFEGKDSTSLTVETILPLLRHKAGFLEYIRKQQFPCKVFCIPEHEENNYRFLSDRNEGRITIQYTGYTDPRFLVRLLMHELCHYTMDSHRAILIPGSRRNWSTYEEVIAETYSLHSLDALRQWSLNQSYKDLSVETARFYQEQADEVRRHTDLMNRVGFRAVPLYDNSFLPEYDNIRAVALRLLPHFEEHPELWRILPHVQDVHPLSDWNAFFGHLMKSVDDECRKALTDLYRSLFA